MGTTRLAFLVCQVILAGALGPPEESLAPVPSHLPDLLGPPLWGRGVRFQFSEGLAPVQVEEKWGYINQKGEIVIKPQFDAAFAFRDGLAHVAVEAKLVEERGMWHRPIYELVKGRSLLNAKWGYIDKKGTFVIQPHFADAARFSEGRAVVMQGRKCGYIDKTGKPVTPFIFDDGQDYSEGLAAVRMGDKWGFIDKPGKLVIRPQFSRAWPFAEGRAAAWTNGPNFYIDRTGKTVINKLAGIEPDITFYYSGHFSEGVAAVGWDIVSRAGLGTTSRHRTRNVYIDKSGKLAVPPNFRPGGFYSSAGAFSEGLAAVRLERGKHFGYIDKTGTFVIKPQFPDAEAFSEGRAKVATDGKCAFIDKTGNVVLKLDYSFWRVSSFHDGAASVVDGDKLGYIDKTGKFIWKPTK